jgi:hypothetical protein
MRSGEQHRRKSNETKKNLIKEGGGTIEEARQRWALSIYRYIWA